MIRQPPLLGDRVRVEHHQFSKTTDGTRFMVAVEVPGQVTAVEVEGRSFRWRPLPGFDVAECWLPVDDDRWRLSPAEPLVLAPRRPPAVKP